MSGDPIGADLTRLIYLVTAHKIHIPKAIARVLPHGAWLGQLHRGLGASRGVPLELAEEAYLRGQALGEGSREEAALLIASLAEPAITNMQSLEDRLSLWTQMEQFVKGSTGSMLFEESRVRLGDLNPDEVTPIQKWESGFPPLDLITGGLYQMLLVLIGRPGTGKTSLMVSIAEALVRQGIRIVFVQNELSQSMMLGKMVPVMKRTQFHHDDFLICTPGYPSSLFQELIDHPDPNRVVLFDSPDAAGGGGDAGEGRRFVLEEIYRDMVALKHTCKAVIVSSQPRRKDASLRMDSVAESWAKAWYADVMVAAGVAGGIRGTEAPIHLKVVKNRHGPNLQEVVFGYDYSDLVVTDQDLTATDDYW